MAAGQSGSRRSICGSWDSCLHLAYSAVSTLPADVSTTGLLWLAAARCLQAHLVSQSADQSQVWLLLLRRFLPLLLLLLLLLLLPLLLRLLLLQLVQQRHRQNRGRACVAGQVVHAIPAVPSHPPVPAKRNRCQQ